MIPNPAKDNCIFNAVIPVHISAATIISGISYKCSTIRVNTNHTWGKTALQQCCFTSTNFPC